MSKATKNFIAGALVATLPLFVASLMKDDGQVVQTAVGVVVTDTNEAKAEELGLVYSDFLWPPASPIDMALQNTDVDLGNIGLKTTTAVAGSKIKVTETFSVDLVWNQKPILGTFIYAGECVFEDGKVIDSGITVRHVATPTWDVLDPEVRRSSANKFRNEGFVTGFCYRMQENGTFDQLREAAAGTASSPEQDI